MKVGKKERRYRAAVWNARLAFKNGRIKKVEYLRRLVEALTAFRRRPLKVHRHRGLLQPVQYAR